MSKDEMVDALVTDMCTWDYQTLLEWAQDARLNDLDGLEDEDVAHVYDAWLGSKS